MQQIEHCRHLGNNAIRADRSSWITNTQRVLFGPELWEYKLMRRRQQTNVVVAMIGEELESKVAGHHEAKRKRSVKAVAGGDDEKVAAARVAFLGDPKYESKLKEIRTKYGIQEGPDPFECISFDPHIGCFRDPDHLFDMGLTRDLLQRVVDTMNSAQKQELSIQLMHFNWPRGYGRITFDLSKSIGSRYSMHFIRKMLLVAICVFRGLCPDSHYDVLSRLFVLRNSLYSTHCHTPASLVVCERQVTELIKAVSKTFGADAVNKPNWHNLIVLVFKDLRIVNNIHLLRTQHFEAKHQGVLSLILLIC